MPYNPNEPRDNRGRWTAGGETVADRYARTFYPDHPTDSEIRFASASGSESRKPGCDLTREEGQAIVDKGKGWENTPYPKKGSPLLGGGAKQGVGGDCSGSVNKIYAESGHPYPYTRSGEFAGAANAGRIPFREIDPKDRQPGDVVVYDGRGHMSIYAGNGDVYSARHEGGKPFGRLPANQFQGRQRYFRYQDRSRQA